MQDQKQFYVFKGIYEFDDPGGTIIASRVPYEGSADLYSGTAIIVKPNQCAVFIYKGEMGDVLSEGLHTVKTGNFPLLTRLAKWQFGFRSPLKCEIWFFSKAVYTGRRWGTTQPVLHDFPSYKAIPIRAYGLYNVVLQDPKKAYMNLIGGRASYDITELESFIQGQLTELLAQTLSIIPELSKLNKYHDAVSKELESIVNKVLEE